MNTVWLLTSGAYSDYKVDAVYSNRGAAERAARILNRGGREHTLYGYWVEEYLLQDAFVLTRQSGYRVKTQRRSGEPTVTGLGSSDCPTPGEPVEEIVNRGSVSYYGDDAAARACARAMSMHLHGEVVEEAHQ